MGDAGHLILERGYRISLHALRQRAIYAGLLEGLPTREGNRGIVERAVAAERDKGKAVLLVPPRETPIRRGTPYPFGEPAALPAILCVADFHSVEPAHEGTFDLTVVWFQDDYALPIDPDVSAHIRGLDWTAVARF